MVLADFGAESGEIFLAGHLEGNIQSDVCCLLPLKLQNFLFAGCRSEVLLVERKALEHSSSTSESSIFSGLITDMEAGSLDIIVTGLIQGVAQAVIWTGFRVLKGGKGFSGLT